MMETVHTCPLGSVCEEAKEGKVYRCRWFLSLCKVDHQGQAIPGSEYDECAIPMQSIHMTDLKKGTIGLQAAIECRHCFGDTQAGVDGTLGIIFMRHRIAEIDQETITEVLHDLPIEALDDVCNRLLIRPHNLAQIFRI